VAAVLASHHRPVAYVAPWRIAACLLKPPAGVAESVVHLAMAGGAPGRIVRYLD
jgi:hypothetical protein